MSYEVKTLADSVSPDGVRLTTLQATFPRFILAEVNTHRVLSRNSASSRAIPTEKLIERVLADPFVPETFNKRVKGMGVGEALNERDMESARNTWIRSANHAAVQARYLTKLDVDKSRANRLLEPFMWHTAIISATEWDNFFGLRDHPAAQPEFQIVAKMMRMAMEGSVPQQLDYGQWHLPLVSEADVVRTDLDDQDALTERLKMISAGRCARVSYDTHENYETQEKSIERAKILMGNGHFSPFEHVARPSDSGPNYFVGNFRGWVQFRKEIRHEDRFDLAIAEQAT